MAQTVSAAFKNAAVADTVQTVVTATATLVDNGTLALGASITATDTQDTTYFNVSQTIDGRTSPDAKWMFADYYDETSGAIVVADGTWYPVDVGYEAGWWSNSISDALGNLAVSEVITLTYASATSIGQAIVYGDPNISYPVNFVLSANVSGVGVVTLATVTGNTNVNYLVNFATVNALSLTLTISKINRGFTQAVLLEFGGSLIVDITSQIVDFDVLIERSTNTATLEVGNTSAGQLGLTLENTTGIWGPNNLASAYYGYLRQNRKIVLKIGYVGAEQINFGTWYSMSWNAPGGGPTASVRAQDRMKILRDKLCGNQPLYVGQTISYVISAVCQAAGLGPADMVINSSSVVIPYAWPEPTATFFVYLSTLAAAAGGVVWIDETNRLHFEDALYLHNNSTVSQFTITDSNAKISNDDIWDEGAVKNQIVVNVNALAPQTLAAIWTLQEVLTVPAGSTYTLTATFQQAATGVVQASFTGGTGVTVQSLTVYAKSAVIVFANSSGAAATVTAYVLNGQLLTANGQSSATAQNSTLTSQYGTKSMPISNTYLQTQAAGLSLASALLSLYQNPPAKIHIKSVGLPWLELGDRVTVNSAQAGINGDFWLVRHDLKYDGSFMSSMDLIAVV